MEGQEMRKQYSELQERSASAQTQMERTQRLLNRIRHENARKSTEMDKLQHEFNSLGDRLRVLENKAMEVEKLEITVDQLKKTLEAAQQDVRDAERQVRRLERILEEKEKIITSKESRMKSLEESNADLKLQVREEIIKNTNLEMRIENTTKLKEELSSKKEEIESLQKQLHDGSLLTRHARQSLREERDRRKRLEGIDRDIEGMSEKVYIMTAENHTLKSLLSAKDVVFRQKSQMVYNLQNILEDQVTSKQYSEIMKTLEKQQNLAWPDEPPTPRRNNGRPRRKSDEDEPCQSLDGPNESTSLLHVILHEDHDGETPSRPRTAVVRPRVYHDSSFANFRSESPTCSDVTSHASTCESNNTWRERNGLRRTQSMRHTSISGSRSTITSSSIEFINGVDSKKNVTINGRRHAWHKPNKDNSLTSEKTAKRLRKISVGDHVVADMSKQKGDGCKLYATGVVKYVGHLDGDRVSYKVYAGLKLDEPDGDTDGLYKGKRHFRVSSRHGKFIRIEKIASVFDKETGQYLPLDETSS